MLSISAGPRHIASTIATAVMPSDVSNAGSVAAVSVVGRVAHSGAVAQVASPVAESTLPNVLWGEVAEFLTRNDVLDFRRVDRKMLACVDRSIGSLTVNADKMPAMLAVLGRSAGFKHIDALTVLLPGNDSLPLAIAALAAIPHAKLNLTIEQTYMSGMHLDATGLACLRDIRPASVSIKGFDSLQPAITQLLSELEYPVSVTARRYWSKGAPALSDLSRVPTLSALNVKTDKFSDDTASRFRQSPCLKTLHIAPLVSFYPPPDEVVISDVAVEHLAASPTLETLSIGATYAPLGERAMIALSKNRQLLTLTIEPGRHPLNDNAALHLSENSTLITLSVSLSDGWSHLTRMASLKHLTLLDPMPITLGEAAKFARGARLQTLNIKEARFEEDALATMVSAAVENLALSVDALSEREMENLLANRNLRSLSCHITGRFSPFVACAIALAAHPTLTSAVFWHKTGSPGYSVMTDVERAAMFAAWGPHRSVGALRTNF